MNDERPRRLLVLDDDPLTGETIARVARFRGFEARHMLDATAFFHAVAAWSPDVIVLDLIMPGLDGVEIIHRLARQHVTARLIITSVVGTRVMEAAERSARRHGLDLVGLLPKPFSSETVTALLARVVAGAPHPEVVAPVGNAVDQSISAEDLRGALDRNEINVYYQPKVSCRSGTLIGFEALARWQHPQRGLIPPDLFVPLAERNGLIDALTRCVMEQALDWMAALPTDPAVLHHPRRKILQNALGVLQLSLNVSALSLGHRDLFEAVVARCQAIAVAPHRVVLELTETSAMQDASSALDNLTRLRLQGFHLSIDDFGTGYSSMVQLVKLPFSELKVDKSFVMTMPLSAESRAIARSVLELGRSLGMVTTAEGVEDADTLAQLKSMGCENAQGYLIAPPLAADAVLPWFLERQKRREAARLASLHRLALLDTPPEMRFDRVTRLARRLFDVDIATMTLVDHDRQWFKSHPGMDAEQTPRSIAFCDATIELDRAFVIDDARESPDYRDNPLVTGPPYIRFYAGQPLSLSDGAKVGALCLIDSKPRGFSTRDAERLAVLAAEVERELMSPRDDPDESGSGVLGRERFHEHVAATLGLCDQLELRLSMVTARLLNLAMVNLRQGAAAGNQLIDALREIVRQAGQDADLLGRRRGAEFDIVLIEAEDAAVEQICQRLREAVRTWNLGRADGAVPMICRIDRVTVTPTAVPAGAGLDWIVRHHASTYAVVGEGAGASG